MIAVSEVINRVTDTCIFSIIVYKFRHGQELYLALLLLMDMKNADKSLLYYLIP